MGMELPGWLEKAAGFVGGQPWPEGDETALMRMAHGYKQAASTLSIAVDDVNAGAAQVRSALEGDAADAMAVAFKDLAQGDGGIEQLIEELNKLGSMCELTAIQISVTKSVIVAALAELVIELAVDAATEWCTFGASTAAAVAEVAATRLAVRAALKQLVERILEVASRQAVKDIAKELGTQAAISGGLGLLKGVGGDLAMQELGNITGLHRGFDLKEAGLAGMNGVISGVESAPGKVAGMHVYTARHGELPTADTTGMSFLESKLAGAQTFAENRLRTAPYITTGGTISEHLLGAIIPEVPNDDQEHLKSALRTEARDAVIDKADEVKSHVLETE